MNARRNWVARLTLLIAIALAAWIAARLLFPSPNLFVIILPSLLAFPAVFTAAIPWGRSATLPWWLTSAVPVLVIDLYLIQRFERPTGFIDGAYLTAFLLPGALFAGKVADSMVKVAILDWQDAERPRRL